MPKCGPGQRCCFDSDPVEEENETELKASAMLAAVREAGKSNAVSGSRETAKVGEGVNILLVDHEDSFVHTLANYFRQTGANGDDRALAAHQRKPRQA